MRSFLTPDTRTPGPSAWLGAIAVGLIAILLAFGRMFMEPGGLIVDADRPGIDPSVPISLRLPGNDLTRLFLPHHLGIARVIRETGRVPTWDARGFGGRPLVGNPQAGLWYPPVWLIWYTGEPGLFGWITVAHQLAGFLGILVLARSLGLAPWSASIAGVAFALNPYIIGQIYAGHLPQVWAATWAPWIVWAARIWSLGDWRGGLAFGPFLSLCILTGHPQLPFLLMVVLSTWFAWKQLYNWCQTRKVWNFQNHIQGGVLIALPLAFTAMEWLPDALAEPWTLNRLRSQAAQVNRYAPGWLNLWQLVDPLALGGPADYQGGGTYWEAQLGMGGPVLLLSIAALCLRARSRIALVNGLFLVVVVGWWITAGRSLGLASLLGSVVPGMSRFRVQGRVLFLVAIAVSLLAGLGTQALNSQRRGAVRALAFLLGGLTLIHLSFEAWLIVKVTPAHGFMDLEPVSWSLQNCRPEKPFRVRAKDRVYSDLQATLSGIEKTNVEDWFQIQHAAELYESLYPMFEQPRPMEWLNPLNSWVLAQVRQGILDRMNVARLISDRAPRGLNATQLVEVPQSIELPTTTGASNQTVYIFDNPTSLPRAYVVPGVVISHANENPAIQLAWIDPRQAVLLANDPLAAFPEHRQVFREANYQSAGPDRVEISVNTEAAGLLVVADTWMPGWSAIVNGQPTKVLCGNHAQQVVVLPSAGNQRVSMRYDPPGLVAGGLLAMGGVGCWLGIGWWLWKQHKLRPSRASCE